MKLNSAYFNMVRARSRKTPSQSEACQTRCQMAGCNASGLYRAPKHQAAEGQWQYFCLEHISDYNKAYNFFAYMSETEILAFQKSSVIGHRPTWNLGAKGPRNFHADRLRDYFDLFRQKRHKHKPRRPRILAHQARALEVLGLSPNADLRQIKSRFKELVKLYHPDRNGGNRKHEHRLKKVIQSYNELRKERTQ